VSPGLEFLTRLGGYLDEALVIADELGRLATCMDAVPRGAVGTQKAKLAELKGRIAADVEVMRGLQT
jgi:hypothetical protein